MSIADDSDLTEEASHSQNTDRMLTKILQKLHRLGPQHDQDADEQHPVQNNNWEAISSEPNDNGQVKIFKFVSLVIIM